MHNIQFFRPNKKNKNGYLARGKLWTSLGDQDLEKMKRPLTLERSSTSRCTCRKQPQHPDAQTPAPVQTIYRARPASQAHTNTTWKKNEPNTTLPSAYIVDTVPAFLWFLSSTLANVGNHNFYWKYRRTKKNGMNDYLHWDSGNLEF
jgi:hypothetical protein